MKQISSSTKLTGIIGFPIGHTLSPLMHNKAFSLLGLDYIYVVFPVVPCDLTKAVRALPALKIIGINVTAPYKQSVLNLLDEISPEARRIGAVNTILVNDNVLYGYNTDGEGFITSLTEAGFDTEGKTILLLGAGGASRAVALSLAWSGAKKINIATRNIQKAKQMVKDIGLFEEVRTECFSLSKLPAKVIYETDLIVNATPLGMSPYENQMALISSDLLHPSQYVCDLVYNPVETLFLKQAKLKGCKTINGIGMLVYQGAKSFSIWTKKIAPVEEMRQVVLDYVGKNRKDLP